MVNRTRCFFFLSLIIQALNVWAEDDKVIPLKKEWTVIVYMAADNSLYPYAPADIEEMKKVGSNEHLNILVYYCTKLPGKQKVTKKLFIKKGAVIQDGPDTVRDSGDTQSVIEALSWAHVSYPSDHLMVVFWDHGSGSLNRLMGNTCRPWHWWNNNHYRSLWSELWHERGCCYDDSTGNYLTDLKLRAALSEIYLKYRKGKKIDIIAFDACLMADIEVAYTVQKYANYFVASQETIPGAGYNYSFVLSNLAKGLTDSREFAIKIVDAYNKEYKGTDDYTLSTLDLSKLTPVVNGMNVVAQNLIELLKNYNQDGQAAGAIYHAMTASNCTRFEEASYMDIVHFLHNLTQTLPAVSMPQAEKDRILKSIKDEISAVNACVIANAKGAQFPNASGLSIYFDENEVDPSYPQLIWSKNTKWWPQFLTNYFAN
ncbi:MAG: Clostripain precursor [Candidatus Dependentiae bacterium ADurb.Bin331]|nr:MAG: Clostripain precursor [Candidatus Dependentiae bacterium ADurb.Bin331]